MGSHGNRGEGCGLLLCSQEALRWCSDAGDFSSSLREADGFPEKESRDFLLHSLWAEKERPHLGKLCVRLIAGLLAAR